MCGGEGCRCLIINCLGEGTFSSSKHLTAASLDSCVLFFLSFFLSATHSHAKVGQLAHGEPDVSLGSQWRPKPG